MRGMSASTAGGDENASASPDKKPSTPTKTKKEKGAATPMTPKGKKGGKKREYEDDEEDDGTGEGSPKSAKKVKVGN